MGRGAMRDVHVFEVISIRFPEINTLIFADRTRAPRQQLPFTRHVSISIIREAQSAIWHLFRGLASRNSKGHPCSKKVSSPVVCSL